jgi:hypothetical protein
MASPVSTEPRTRARRRVSVSDIQRVLHEIASEEPDHADRRAVDGLPARYLDHGQPNCLVARVLHRLGFSIGVLRALDEEYPTGELVHSGVEVGESRHPALKRIDPLALRLLQHVQSQQDRGERWGRIVKDAFTVRRAVAYWDRRNKPWLTGRELR